jgi:hypothetical protein
MVLAWFVIDVTASDHLQPGARLSNHAVTRTASRDSGDLRRDGEESARAAAGGP